MWLSRKISSIIKHKASFHHRKKEEHISFVLGITSGAKNTGKSTLIKSLALVEITDESHIMPSNHSRDGKLYRLKNNDQFVLQIIEYNGVPSMKLSSLDGMFICYDVTNRDSMDALPDITNTFIANQVPCLLIGLKSDLTVLRTVDPHLGHLIGNLFGVQAIEADNFTVAAAKPAIIPSIILSPPPPPTIPTSCNTKTATTDEASSIESIIDQLVNTTSTLYADENGITIFLTVFRKFMKPSQLVKILIQRFEFDLINQEHHFKSSTTTEKFILPTTRQERIRSFLCIWLSHYWGDFKSSVTRRMLLDFLEGVSLYPELKPICDVLMPLAMRDPALKDKDALWAMTDQESCTSKDGSSSNKKDSGYCDSFQWLDAQLEAVEQQQQSKSLKRAASTNSSIPVAFKSILSATSTTLDKRNSTPVSMLIQQKQRHADTLPSRKSSMDRSAVFGGGIIPIQYDPSVMMYYRNATHPFDVLLKTLTPIKLAEQLTWIDQELFRKIQPRDFLRHHAAAPSHPHQNNSSKRRKRDSAAVTSKDNPVLASIEHFNFVSGWIASLIVSQVCMQKRIHVFEFCLQTAVHLRQLNNFNTLMAVLAGINSAPVLRLKQTRLAVQCKNRTLYDQYLALETLMSSERSFCHYRTALKEITHVPGIPYLGIHIQDLVSLGEANKDYKANGKVHWKKFRLIGETILQVMRFQYPTYTALVPDSFVIYFIGHEGTVLTEDERYERSVEIEPRSLKPSPSTSSSTTASSSSRWLLTRHQHRLNHLLD
ncbi:hypothetical protein MUCCIDRAFT_79325 [Mucor lusitanicus CBS 277.49]|uniref:Ras-GEF domain-containing protein n=1 Tax=Mucor lusitanicus CBS 277.49 TaxID=747725 RepID=A0A168M0C9_MUCCL|nr:hypothetical protein MUCCIDRAFT_79325 [Mucor lusitanicus CBS 277.49]